MIFFIIYKTLEELSFKVFFFEAVFFIINHRKLYKVELDYILNTDFLIKSK